MTLIKSGVVNEDSTTELLYGVLVYKDRSDKDGDQMGHGQRHRGSVRRLTKLVVRVDGPRRHMQIQLPVVCSQTHAPEPDGSILRGVDDDYNHRMPQASDCVCVIEIADSSILRDKHEKLPAYAGAGIPQYVIINTSDEEVEVYSSPDRTSRSYGSLSVFKKGESFSLLVEDEVTIDVAVDELLI